VCEKNTGEKNTPKIGELLFKNAFKRKIKVGTFVASIETVVL
jgi:hypothetical protein